MNSIGQPECVFCNCVMPADVHVPPGGEGRGYSAALCKTRRSVAAHSIGMSMNAA